MAIIGEQELQGRLKQMLPKARIAILQGLTDSALMVERDAKIKAAVDTGRLRSSISHELDEDGNNPSAKIGTNVEYAKFVEFGTSRQAAQPYLYPALTENQSKIKRKIADAMKRGLGL